MNNSETLATLGTHGEDNKTQITTQYVLDTTLRNETEIT
jgi:hypothetical protein